MTIWCSMRGWDKQQQRAVYQPYILAMQLLTIICLHWLAPSRARHETWPLCPLHSSEPWAALRCING